jgi:hypothetical protein
MAQHYESGGKVLQGLTPPLLAPMDVDSALGLFTHGFMRVVALDQYSQVPMCTRCGVPCPAGTRVLMHGGLGVMCQLCVDCLLPFVPIQKKDLVFVSANTTWSALLKRRLRMTVMGWASRAKKAFEEAAKWS